MDMRKIIRGFLAWVSGLNGIGSLLIFAIMV